MRNKFYQTFEDQLTPVLNKSSQKKEEETLFNSFYEARITLIQKSKTSQEMKTTDQYPL